MGLRRTKIHYIGQFGDQSVEHQVAGDHRFVSAGQISQPQAKYFVYYPLILGFAAILLWIFPTDKITAVSSGIAAVIGSLMMWEFLFTSKVIRLTNICAMTLTIGYGAGTLNSWLTLSRAGYPLATAVGQPVQELADGLAAALMGCAVLLLLGELLEKPVWTIAQRLRITPGVRWIAIFNSAILFIAFVSGKFVRGGINNGGKHHAGIVGELLGTIFEPTVILVTLILIEKGGRGKYLFGTLFLVLWVLLATQGRMPLVYSVFICIAMARYAGYKWNKFTAGRVIFMAVGVLFLFFAVLTYQLLRLAGGSVSKPTLGAEIGQVHKWEEQGKAWQIASRSSESNVQRRTLVVTFLSSLLHHTKTETPAFGKDLWLQFQFVIPSIIYPDKLQISEENLASKTFHVFYTDQPNSIFTAGALDFGVWGVMVYPIAMILILSIFLRLGATYFSYDVFLFGLLLFLYTVISAELQMQSYFLVMRNMLAFGMLFYIVSKLQVFQLGHTAEADI